MSQMEQDIKKAEESNFDCDRHANSDGKSFEQISEATKRPLISITGKVLLVVLLISSVLIFITGFIRYSELQNDKEALMEQIEEKEDDIEEMEYLLDIPLTDKDYIVRIAKEKLGLFLPDEIVYYSDLNK